MREYKFMGGNTKDLKMKIKTISFTILYWFTYCECSSPWIRVHFRIFNFIFKSATSDSHAVCAWQKKVSKQKSRLPHWNKNTTGRRCWKMWNIMETIQSQIWDFQEMSDCLCSHFYLGSTIKLPLLLSGAFCSHISWGIVLKKKRRKRKTRHAAPHR